LKDDDYVVASTGKLTTLNQKQRQSEIPEIGSCNLFSRELCERIFAYLDHNQNDLCIAFDNCYRDRCFAPFHQRPTELLHCIDQIRALKSPFVGGRNFDRVWRLMIALAQDKGGT